MTYIELYWFFPFLKFGPLPPENPRYAPAKDVISAGPTQEFGLHATTIHPPTIKALQTRKATKLSFLPLPH